MAQSRSRSEPPSWLPEQVSRIRCYAIPALVSPLACQRSFYRTNVTSCLWFTRNNLPSRTDNGCVSVNLGRAAKPTVLVWLQDLAIASTHMLVCRPPVS